MNRVCAVYLYWGIIGVSASPFLPAPQNSFPRSNGEDALGALYIRLQTTLTTTMILDYVGCWAIGEGIEVHV